MQHGHREGQRAAAGGVFGRGFDGLVFDEPRERVVEVEFVVRDLKLGGADDAFGEQRLHFASFRIRERNEGFLHAAQVKRGFLLSHCLLQTFHIAINVPVQQFEEQAEVIRVALVGRRCHQEVMVGHFGQLLRPSRKRVSSCRDWPRSFCGPRPQ